MIKEFQFYHGVVFSMLVHYRSSAFTLAQFPSADNASYVLDDNVGLYIKYSKKRMSPWHFSFETGHHKEIHDMESLLSRVTLLLVCKDDGVVGLTTTEYRSLADPTENQIEWISVMRKQREKYTVKGPGGKLPLKIGMIDFCEKIFPVQT